MIRIDCHGIAVEEIATSSALSDAGSCFVKHGYAILDRVVPEATVHALRAEFDLAYARYQQDREAEDSIEVGNRRFMIPLRLAGGFGSTEIFANPWVVALTRRVLEDDAILEAFGAVLSLSGSEAQHRHIDAPHLFSTEVSTILPAHALTFALPLIEMNTLNGTTAIWPGSHRKVRVDKDVPPELPVIPVGSCFLWDYRLLHSGTPNRSSEHRPMVYATYARPWYQDPVNFQKKGQSRLLYDDSFVKELPDDLQRLFKPRI